MKNKIGVGLLCVSLLSGSLCARVAQKDKDILTELKQLERSIASVTEIANQIQNVVLDVTVNNHENKDCCHRILEKLENIELLLAVIIQQLALQKQVIGNLDDQSVDEQEFDSVSDIDNAELTVISWLKTIFRRDWVKDNIS